MGERVTGMGMLRVIRMVFPVVLPAVVVVVVVMVAVGGFGVSRAPLGQPAVRLAVCPLLNGNLAVRGVGLALAPSCRDGIPVLAADEGGMTQGSPSAHVALGRPEGLVSFAAAALERGGTVAVLVLTSPDLGCLIGEVCRPPR